MFEQQLYSFEGPAEPSREGDLFHSYEVKSWNLSTRIYQILAISLVLNLAILGFVGQAELLTTRGCDSPFVGRVCQVLDMAYVGTVLFGTDREYVDAAYEKVDLEDAEITYIDVSGVTPPLDYPEGYFQIANPEQYAMLQQQQATDPLATTPGYLAPGIPSTSGNSIFDTQAKAPKYNPNPVQGDLPSDPLAGIDTSGADKPKRPRKEKSGSTTNVNSETPDETQTAKEPKVDKTDPVSGVNINKRPIEDLGNMVNDLTAKNELDLQTEFVGSAKGKLTKDGRIDPKTLKLQIQSPDADMQKVVQEGILAIDAAGYLQYLKDLSGKNFDLLLKQDQENISAVVQSEMESDKRASSIKSSLDLALSIAKMNKTSDQADQNDKDDLLLLENAKIETVGNKVIITFTVPKTIAHPMIQRKLAEQAAEMKKPSGNAQTQVNNNTAIK